MSEPTAQYLQTPAVGSTFQEKYLVASVVCEGGPQTAFLAEDKGSQRRVSIKFLDKNIVDTDYFRNFGDSSDSADPRKGLAHPNITPLHERGLTAGGIPYAVYEYTPGNTLSQLMHSTQRGSTSKPLSIHRFMSVFRQIIAALGYAHSQGVVHRSLDPSCISIGHDSQGNEIVQITDFGTAKPILEVDDLRALIASGTIDDAVQYMSPERCSGMAIDHRSDIYSLGCMMYEALTGHKPFNDKTPLRIMERHKGMPPDLMRLRQCKSDVALRIEALVFKLLDKRPAARYQSIGEVSAELDAIAAMHPVTTLGKVSMSIAHWSAKGTPTPQEAQTRRRVALGIAITMLAAGFGAGAYAYYQFQNSDRQKLAQQESLESKMTPEERCDLHLSEVQDRFDSGDLKSVEKHIQIAEAAAKQSAWRDQEELRCVEARRGLALRLHDSKMLEVLTEDLTRRISHTSSSANIEHNNTRIRTLKNKLSSDPGHMPTKRALVQAVYRQSQALSAKQHATEAANLLKSHLGLIEQTSGRHSTEWASACSLLARCCIDRGNLIDAEPLLKEAFLVRTNIEPRDRLHEAVAHVNLGDLYLRSHNLPRAESEYRQSIQLHREITSEGTLHQLYAEYWLSVALDGQKRYREAIAITEASLRMTKAVKHADEEFGGALRVQLGRLLFNMKRYSEAKSTLKDLLSRKSATPRDLALGHFYLGQVLWFESSQPEAAENWQEALRLYPPTLSPNVDIKSCYSNLRYFYHLRGQSRLLKALDAAYAKRYKDP